MGSQNSVKFGEENDPETEEVQDMIAHNREDLDQTHEEEEDTYHDANLGIGEFHGGFGSALLRKSSSIFRQPLCYLPTLRKVWESTEEPS